jgi:DNA-binding response OmpR family regulator
MLVQQIIFLFWENTDEISVFEKKKGRNDRMIKILIVEDEAAIADLVRMNLQKAGYECTVAYSGREGADQLAEQTFDLCIFDIMLPEIDGYELLDYANRLDTPVIFLTAKGEVSDKVKGLRQGAEDYITKPFAVLELLARVENVLRRHHKAAQEFDACGLHIDIPSRSVSRDGKEIDLTYKEFNLLLLFMQNPGIALYREVIYEQVWGSFYMGDSRTVDLHVQRLRKKTGLEQEIESVYKVGYRLRGSL